MCGLAEVVLEIRSSARRDKLWFILGRLWDNIRDYTRHDTLVITKQEHTQRHEYARKVAVAFISHAFEPSHVILTPMAGPSGHASVSLLQP